MKLNASYVVSRFKTMVDEHWDYVAGSAKVGAVDCSGAWVLAASEKGKYLPHGSNSMWYGGYLSEKNSIGNIDLIPGMPVFKSRKWSGSESSNKWYESADGDMYHVGCYIGDGKVAEAKGSKYGCVYSCISDWAYAGRFKAVTYDTSEGEDTPSEQKDEDIDFSKVVGIVATESGSLNMRNKPTTSGSVVLIRIPRGTTITLTEKKDGWYKAKYNGYTGWVSGEYISVINPEDPAETEGTTYKITIFTTDEDELQEIESFLGMNNISYEAEPVND